MLGHAANYAQSIGADRVWYGATADDFTEYHDCRPIFINAINAGLQDVRIEPLSEHHKPQIRTLMKKHGILMGRTWSCYAPIDDKPCRTCDSCKMRQSDRMTLQR